MSKRQLLSPSYYWRHYLSGVNRRWVEQCEYQKKNNRIGVFKEETNDFQLQVSGKTSRSTCPLKWAFQRGMLGVSRLSDTISIIALSSLPFCLPRPPPRPLFLYLLIGHRGISELSFTFKHNGVLMRAEE